MGFIFILFSHPIYLFFLWSGEMFSREKGALSFGMKEGGIAGPVPNQ